MKKSKSILLLIIISWVNFSCDSWPDYSNIDCSSPDYSNCSQDEPVEGVLKITVTINDENPLVPIAFYRGKFEESELIYLDTLTSKTKSFYVSLNEFYTITATYKKGNRLITAIDGDEVSSHSTQVCDRLCWDVKNGEVDVRLK